MAKKQKKDWLPVDAKCDKCDGAREPLHNCPLARALGRTDEERNIKCRCCDNCTSKCAMEV